MEITAQLELHPEERTSLARILQCENAELESKLAPFASAAIMEYATMMLGQKVFSRGSDLLEYRLYLMIEHALGKRLPDDKEVSRLFQTTASESRSLIRSVMSKYQYHLSSAVDDTLRDLMGSAQADENNIRSILVNGANLVDELNRILADLDGTLPPVTKKRGSVAEYSIAASSFEKLSEHLAK